MITWILDKALKFLSQNKNAKVLDVGCGRYKIHGTQKFDIYDLAKAILNNGFDLTGIDLKDVEVQFSNFKFLKENFLRTSLADKSFDLVISCLTWNLIGKKNPGYLAPSEALDPEEGDKNFIRQIYRILKDDGLVLLAFTITTGKYDPSFRSLTIERVEEDLAGFFEIINYDVLSETLTEKIIVLELKKGKELGKKIEVEEWKQK